MGAEIFDANNIVLGDSGYIDWTAAEHGYPTQQAGDDNDPTDIDRIWSTDTDHGGSDSIYTGQGDDIIIGGENDATVADDAEPSLIVESVEEIYAGGGDNLVFGDSGQIIAAQIPNGATDGNFNTQPITLGLVTTVESLVGGADMITTGIGRDIVLGGIDGDTITANDGENVDDEIFDANNIVIGDSGYIDWTAAEHAYAPALPGDDNDATDIDRIWSIDTDDGGSDVIHTGQGDDIIIGGEDGEIVTDEDGPEDTVVVADPDNVDEIDAGGGVNLVFGDSGQINARARSRRIAWRFWHTTDHIGPCDDN